MDGAYERNLKQLMDLINNNPKPINLIQESELEIGAKIGKGRFEVFKGRWKDKNVAIKAIPKNNVFSEPEALIQEVNMCDVIPHERVPKFHGLLITKSFVYMVMDLIENAKTLAECFECDYKMKISYFIQLIGIIKDLHENNIIHRDLKPLNVMVNDKDEVFLIDFGTSKFCSGTTTATKDSRGTTFYMPPENLEYEEFKFEEDEDADNDNDNGSVEGDEDEDNEKRKPFRVSIQFDIWSLGCIISEIVTKIRPWTNLDWNSFDYKSLNLKKKKEIDNMLMMDLLTNKVEFPIPKDIDPNLYSILEKCFKINPKERLTIRELQKHLIDYYSKL